jgi:translocation and assembly module TamA
LTAAARTACTAGSSSIAWSIDRALLLASAAAWIFAGPAAFAQQQSVDPQLEELIPEAAVLDPESWAKGQEAAQPEKQPAEPELDPASPLSDSTGIALPWPEEAVEIPQSALLEPLGSSDLAASEAAVEPEDLPVRTPGETVAISQRVAIVFPAGPDALPVRSAIEQRFRSLSALENLTGQGGDSPAQIAVRARADRDLLARLMRAYGYYNADVAQSISGAQVRYEVTPGVRYRFGAVDLGGLEKTGKAWSQAPKSGDPIDGAAVLAARGGIELALGEDGYPFARAEDPVLTIDHRREEGDLVMPVSPGGRYAIGGITSNLEQFMPADHLRHIARFRNGEVYRLSQIEDYRRAILATGLVSSVSVTPRETAPPQGQEPGTVVLDTMLAKAPLRTISGAAGYDSGDGPRVEVAWEHRNLFPPEGMLRLRGILGTKEQLAGITLRKNNFQGRDRVMTYDLYASRTNRDAYDARTFAFNATFERLTTLIFQKPWVWSAGVEVLFSREREGAVNGINSPSQNYYIAALPLRAAFDASDDLLDPKRGFRAALRVSPEIAIGGGRKFGYARIQADASGYLPLGKTGVLAARVRLGSIPGTNIADIAPSRRFYAGGGGSVRGYGYQKIGPRNSLGDPSGGRSLTEASLEARIATGLFGGALSVAPFFDAGTVDAGITPTFKDMRFGAGVGVRYQTGFGPIRVDLGTPLNRRPGDSRVAVYVALGQAF